MADAILCYAATQLTATALSGTPDAKVIDCLLACLIDRAASDDGGCF